MESMKSNYIVTKKMAKKLKEIGVAVVYLFGSYAEGKNMEHSDIDIAVLLDYKTGHRTILNDVYNKLYFILSDLLPGKNIDLVLLNRATLELRMDVIINGKIIYAKTADEQFSFEEKTILDYADFKPVLDQFNHAVLERVKEK